MKNEVRVYWEEVRDHLRGLADGSIMPRWSCSGVCSELKDIFNVRYVFSMELSRRFHNFSGDVEFPIGGGRVDYFRYSDLWIGWQGDDRRDYCDYLADCIDEYLGE